GNNGWSSLITFQGFVGFWIKIPDSAPLASYDVVMKGQVPLGSTSSNVVAGGLNMLGFPYTADVVFSNTALFANSQVGDQLVLWNPATSNYSGGQYVKAGFGANPWGAGSSVVLKQGVGFWYASNTNVPKLYVEGRPYSGN
ncbi:MAG: hypothetical protein O3B24_05910, partial [Verrucomicrobia bacterium]|nr:hypothetical protein [Verrucomicrobiota bacterium]